MAEIAIADGSLILRMTSLEHVEGFHADIRVPLTQVRSVRPSTDLWSELRGIRAPGTGLPGVIAVGTRRGEFGKDFAAVHGRGPGVVVDLRGSDFSRLIISCADPAAVVTRVTAELGRSL